MLRRSQSTQILIKIYSIDAFFHDNEGSIRKKCHSARYFKLKLTIVQIRKSGIRDVRFPNGFLLPLKRLFSHPTSWVRNIPSGHCLSYNFWWLDSPDNRIFYINRIFFCSGWRRSYRSVTIYTLHMG